MANRNNLAALANDFGSIESAADALGVDSNILQSAIDGEALSRNDAAELAIAYGTFEQNNTDEYLDEIDVVAELLTDSQNLINDIDTSNQLREAFADGNISVAELSDLFTLWGQGYMTHSNTAKIVEWLNSPDGDAAKLTELYLEEEDDFGYHEDSDFWEWFRDTFYND